MLRSFENRPTVIAICNGGGMCYGGWYYSTRNRRGPWRLVPTPMRYGGCSIVLLNFETITCFFGVKK
jgi:hypothetical protein